jgi:hypothetical protein
MVRRIDHESGEATKPAPAHRTDDSTTIEQKKKTISQPADYLPVFLDRKVLANLFNTRMILVFPV